MLMSSLLNVLIPSAISYSWNFGSLLGVVFSAQILSGLLLILNYINLASYTFDYCIELFFDYNSGWLLHNVHANGASLMFIALYIHFWRGLYFNSYSKMYLWMSGVLLLLLSMLTAFLGYVLPWGQMSYWGTTVITGLVSVVPLFGYNILKYIWGSEVVGSQTLSRFMILHFLMPFVMLLLVLIHLSLLHNYGSSNPFGVQSAVNTVSFDKSFFIKDTWYFYILLSALIYLANNLPYLMGECENWLESDPMVTPSHIQPEWYFLFAYAILRAVPNKLGGVLALLSAVMVFLLFPFMKKKVLNSKMSAIFGVAYWSFFIIFIFLSFLGMMPAVEPFITLSQVMSCLYFMSAIGFLL